MQTAAIYIRTNPEIKIKAQKVAKELGLSLSSLMNGWLRQLIKTKTVTFSARGEIPSTYLVESLRKSDDDIKKRRISPGFDNAKDAIAWLNKK